MHYFQTGGIFMWAILGSLLFTVALIIDRTRALYWSYGKVPSDFQNRIRDFISQSNPEAAKNYALVNASGSGVGRIAAIGLDLRARGCGEEEIQARMDEALSSEITKLDKGTGFLGMLGNVATLLGLLGTITGMIRSFSAVSMLSAAERAMALSAGISEALHATAFGLIVAVPALVAYAIFRHRTDQIASTLTDSTSRIYHDLVFLTESADQSVRPPTK